jgi:hypothetical protein
MIPALIGGLIQIVPSIVRLIGGDKAGKAADKVMAVAEEITGQKGDAAVKAIAADPTLALTFERALMDQESKFYELQLIDVQNARARDVDLRKLGQRNWRGDAMVIAAFAAVIAIIWLLSVGKIGESSAAAGCAIAVCGMFARNIGTVFDFEFGSSRGSRDKDELLGSNQK